MLWSEAMILAGIGLLLGAAMVVFFLRETGITERERDRDDVAGGWSEYGKERSR